ncbi:helix-turn-helix domain-containing protein [Streptomyces somaliensis DSM 40738]|uniref:PucR family transcriptional regulator n=1 Tax=Streptomyces somaliensis (strain ATCC 33201 / DSM 40738 / JCM 12659 / KCTC 9044 / NCTC 11332 / NRRL B-12077 / IP 733) TaxID=1134445 RepID=A0AA44DA97_STRE0|nr:helix-turn-helix domain-containing protein [Streptomyces somaliensis]MCQ0024323.1 helix-turn-helix domain-containing protein [Streptomyces somaliensis DSM 40738]NKY12690.1 PucR family transcriptional regulator [Streptomyces somaliensis DSM 40738]
MALDTAVGRTGGDGEGPTLERLLSAMGAGALEPLLVPRGLGVVVEGIAVLDPMEPGPQRGRLLLAVGVDPQSAAAVDVVRDAAGAAAVVFGPGRPGRAPDALRAAAEDSGTAVLLRTAWCGWIELVSALRAGLVLCGVSADPVVAGVSPGDLNGLADAVAVLVGGAVTIEDVESRVLAYSSTKEGVDEVRRLTILNRRVPEWRVAAMREAGFFRRLWGSEDVIHRPAHGENPERLVVAVRAGGEILGSIWVAAAGGDLPPHASDTLRSAARVAAAHLLQYRSHRTQARLVEDTARALLDGRGSADVLAERTGIPARGHCAVLAVRPGPSCKGEETGKLYALLTVGCAAYDLTSVVVPVEQEVLVVVGGLRGEARRAVEQVARLGGSLVRQLTDVFGPGTRIGLGTVVETLAELPGSRRSAVLALRALLSAGESRAVASAGEVAETIALNQMLDTLAGHGLEPDTPVARLVAYDAEHGGSALVRTLRAYLDHFGRVPDTARALGVHANSLRHRITRLTEVSGLDLHDPDARLLAQVQLRLLDRGRRKA